jgi:hypothetical protein
MTPPKDSKELREQVADYIRTNVDLALSFNWTLPQHETQVDEATDHIMSLFDSYAKEFGRRERLDELEMAEVNGDGIVDNVLGKIYVAARRAQLSQTVSEEREDG